MIRAAFFLAFVVYTSLFVSGCCSCDSCEPIATFSLEITPGSDLEEATIDGSIVPCDRLPSSDGLQEFLDCPYSDIDSAGSHSVEISVEGYEPQTVEFEVTEGPTTGCCSGCEFNPVWVDVVLVPL